MSLLVFHKVYWRFFNGDISLTNEYGVDILDLTWPFVRLSASVLFLFLFASFDMRVGWREV